MRRPVYILVLVAALLGGMPRPAAAAWDLLLLFGRTFPTYDDRLTFRIPSPAIPGVDVNVVGTPVLTAEGDMTFGIALTAEVGVIGVEGRLDSAGLGFDLTGARYELTGVSPPLAGLSGSLVLPNGHFDADRLNLLSLNLRLRTPGPVGLVVSGGVTYLPNFDVGGSVPITLQVDSASGEARVRLVVAPQESRHRVGVNAGGGLRIGGGRVALVAEGRAFYFREYELTFASDDDDPLLNQLLASFEPVRFRPLIITAQVGLLVRF